MKKSPLRFVTKPLPELNTEYPTVGELALLASQLLGKSDILDENSAAQKALALWRASSAAIYTAREAEAIFPTVVHEEWYIRAKKMAEERYQYPAFGETLTVRQVAEALYGDDRPNSLKMLAALVRKNGEKVSQRVTRNQFWSWAVWREVERLEVQEAEKSKWGKEMAARREQKKKTNVDENKC